MTDKHDRIIPPGQFGSLFFEPSLSMRGDEPHCAFSGEPLPHDGGDLDEMMRRFFEHTHSGGTSCTPAFELTAHLADAFPPCKYDRYTFVITDGDTPDGVPAEQREETLRTLMGKIPPGCDLVFLDCSGAQPPFAELTAPRVISGDGLLPVPSADELVQRVCATFDGTGAGDAPADGADKCCGCGGCDKSNRNPR